MPDPFKLFGKLLLACFKITGYFIVFVVQVSMHIIFRQPEKIGDAIGYLGRGAVDAFGDIFK
jgi:hypothetical protein